MEILQGGLQLSTRSAGPLEVACPEAGSLVQGSLPAAGQGCPEGGLPSV